MLEKLHEYLTKKFTNLYDKSREISRNIDNTIPVSAIPSSYDEYLLKDLSTIDSRECNYLYAKYFDCDVKETLTSDMQHDLLLKIRIEQKLTLEQWVNYLYEQPNDYSIYFKDVIFKSVLNLGLDINYKKSIYQITKRVRSDIDPYILLNKDLIKSIYQQNIIKEDDNLVDFDQNVEIFQENYISKLEEYYKQNDDQLGMNGFWSKHEEENYYHSYLLSLSVDKDTKTDCSYSYCCADTLEEIIIIKTKDNKVKEISIASDYMYNLPYLSVLSKRLDGFECENEYLEVISAVKKIAIIKSKINKKEELTLEEAKLLFDLDNDIYKNIGETAWIDRMKKEVRDIRWNCTSSQLKMSGVRLFGCLEEEIATKQIEINSNNNIKYYIGDLYFNQYQIPSDFKNLKLVVGNIFAPGVENASNLKKLEIVTGDFSFENLLFSIGLDNLQYIGGVCDFSNLPDVTRLKSLKNVGGTMYLNKIESAAGLENLIFIKGDLCCPLLTDSSSLLKLVYVGGNAIFSSLTDSKGLENLLVILGNASFPKLKSATGLKSLGYIGGQAEFSSLDSITSLENLMLIGTTPMNKYQKNKVYEKKQEPSFKRPLGNEVSLEEIKNFESWQNNFFSTTETYPEWFKEVVNVSLPWIKVSRSKDPGNNYDILHLIENEETDTYIEFNQQVLDKTYADLIKTNYLKENDKDKIIDSNKFAKLYVTNLNYYYQDTFDNTKIKGTWEKIKLSDSTREDWKADIGKRYTDEAILYTLLDENNNEIVWLLEDYNEVKKIDSSHIYDKPLPVILNILEKCEEFPKEDISVPRLKAIEQYFQIVKKISRKETLNSSDITFLYKGDTLLHGMTFDGHTINTLDLALNVDSSENIKKYCAEAFECESENIATERWELEKNNIFYYVGDLILNDENISNDNYNSLKGIIGNIYYSGKKDLKNFENLEYVKGDFIAGKLQSLSSLNNLKKIGGIASFGKIVSLKNLEKINVYGSFCCTYLGENVKIIEDEKYSTYYHCLNEMYEDKKSQKVIRQGWWEKYQQGSYNLNFYRLDKHDLLGIRSEGYELLKDGDVYVYRLLNDESVDTKYGLDSYRSSSSERCTLMLINMSGNNIIKEVFISRCAGWFNCAAMIDVLEEKLSEFENKSDYDEELRNMRLLNSIERKSMENQPLNREELTLLYEGDKKPPKIKGYNEEKREDIRFTRNEVQDANYLYRFKENKAYDGDFVFDRIKDATYLELPETVRRISLLGLNTTKGLELPRIARGDERVGGVADPEKLTCSEIVEGDLVLAGLHTGGLTTYYEHDQLLRHSPISTKNLNLPKLVKGSVYLYVYIADVDKLAFPEFEGDLFMKCYDTAKGLILPRVIKSVTLSGLKSAEDVVFSEEIEGKVCLNDLIDSTCLVLPKSAKDKVESLKSIPDFCFLDDEEFKKYRSRKIEELSNAKLETSENDKNQKVKKLGGLKKY